MLGPAMMPEQLTELLEALGFSKVATVDKVRRPFWIEYDGQKVECAYDIVDRLGAFVELELIVDESGLEDAKRVVNELASKLDLGPSITRSYLELLLEPKYPRRKK
jgi:predicted adenylyl cyclase CyaB